MTNLDLFVGQKRYESALPSTSNTHKCNHDIIFAVHQKGVNFVSYTLYIKFEAIWVNLPECELFFALLDLLSLRNLILIEPCWFRESLRSNLRLLLQLSLGAPSVGNGVISSLLILLCIYITLFILPRI